MKPHQGYAKTPPKISDTPARVTRKPRQGYAKTPPGLREIPPPGLRENPARVTRKSSGAREKKAKSMGISLGLL